MYVKPSKAECHISSRTLPPLPFADRISLSVYCNYITIYTRSGAKPPRPPLCPLSPPPPSGSRVRTDHWSKSSFVVGPSRPFRAEVGHVAVLKLQAAGAQTVTLWTRDQSTTLQLMQLSER